MLFGTNANVRDAWPLLLSLAILVVAPVVLGVLLLVVLSRERVKRAIHDAGFKPIRVRWRPFAQWAPAQGGGTAFDGIYADATGLPQHARFWVSRWHPRVTVDSP